MTTETAGNLAFEFEGNVRNATDDFLILAAKSGNDFAFVELSRRHSKSIQLTVYRMLGNWEDAEDVLQDSLLKAFEHLGQFRGALKFSTWLTKIAINSALMLMRKRRARPETSFDKPAGSTEISDLWEPPDLFPSPEVLSAERETEELLRSAIGRLPWCYRPVVDLYHAKEYSTNEMAQTLGISCSCCEIQVVAGKNHASRNLARTRLVNLRLP
jgi:RNA polymerase sigma-70 factor (ECF subfamily)